MNSGFAERVRELRRRHFGAQGKAEIAAQLGLTQEAYESIERGVAPSAETIVRICEISGEDLQWLLTGVPSRGTVVISGARGRHFELVAKIARVLESDPELARPIEAFVDLLTRAPSTPDMIAEDRALPEPKRLIPILSPDQLPERFPNPPDTADPSPQSLLALPEPAQIEGSTPASISEPAQDYNDASLRAVKIVRARDDNGRALRFVECAALADRALNLVGVEVEDDAMAPMFRRGDALIVALGSDPKLGSPALCRFAGEQSPRCRVWLGFDEWTVRLGQVSDGACESVGRERLLWSFEVIFRVSPAA